VAAAQTAVKQYNQQSARTAHQKIALTSLVTSDLTRARRVAAARAEELGVSPEQALRIDPEAEDPVNGSLQDLGSCTGTARGGLPRR
jgi:broad specificity phosphatase PhoE